MDVGEVILHLLHEILDWEFEQTLIRGGQKALVDLWAPWCTPCKVLLPTLEKLSEKYKGKLIFYKLNIDANPRTPGRYKVMSVPTILLLQDGEVIDRIVGLTTERTLVIRLDKIVV